MITEKLIDQTIAAFKSNGEAVRSGGVSSWRTTGLGGFKYAELLTYYNSLGFAAVDAQYRENRKNRKPYGHLQVDMDLAAGYVKAMALRYTKTKLLFYRDHVMVRKMAQPVALAVNRERLKSFYQKQQQS
jgi:hypothetical protein